MLWEITVASYLNGHGTPCACCSIGCLSFFLSFVLFLSLASGTWHPSGSLATSLEHSLSDSLTGSFSSPHPLVWGPLELGLCLLSVCTCFLGISLHALSATTFMYHLYPRWYLQICLQLRPLSELQIPICYPHVCQPLYLYPVVISHPAWLRLTSDLALLPPLQTTGILAFSLSPQPTCEQFLWVLSSKFLSLSASQCLYWGGLSLVGMSIRVQSFLSAEPTSSDPCPTWSEENPGGRSPKCCAISASRAWVWATTSPHGFPCG